METKQKREQKNKSTLQAHEISCQQGLCVVDPVFVSQLKNSTTLVPSNDSHSGVSDSQAGPKRKNKKSKIRKD